MTTSSQTRVALITGAAQGIGAAIALRLAEDGIHIALADLPSSSEKIHEVAKQIEAKGSKAVVMFGDVSQEESVKSLVEKCVESLGSLDIMIANAGIGKVASLLETSLDLWETTQAVNARGVFLCYKYAALQMIKQGRGGRIIGASSIGGKRGSPYLGAYCATKFAVRGLTQVAAQEFAPHNITVNAYAPTFLATNMNTHPDDDKLGGPGAWIKQKFGIPADYSFPPPDVVTELISYLIKPEAQFVTGETINLNGTIHFD